MLYKYLDKSNIIVEFLNYGKKIYYSSKILPIFIFHFTDKYLKIIVIHMILVL